jgi:hypothetical protein
VGPRAGLHAVVNRKIPIPCRDTNPRSSSPTNLYERQVSSVSIVTRLCAEDLGSSSRRDISLFAPAFKPILGSSQPPNQWLPGLSLGVERPGHEAGHSRPSSGEVENAWSCTPTSPTCHLDVVLKLRNGYDFMVWYLVKDRDNLNFVTYQCEL